MSTQTNHAVANIERHIIRFHRIYFITFLVFSAALDVYIVMTNSKKNFLLDFFMFIPIVLIIGMIVFGLVYVIFVNWYFSSKIKRGAALLTAQLRELVSSNYVLYHNEKSVDRIYRIDVYMHALAIDITKKQIVFTGTSTNYTPIILPKDNILNVMVSKDSFIHTSGSASGHVIGNTVFASSSSVSQEISKFFLKIRYKNAKGSVSTLVMPFGDSENKAHEFKETIDIL